MDALRIEIESSAYARGLGVELLAVEAGRLRLRLPFADALTNGDQVMHGGCAATLGALGARLLTRQTLGEGSGPWHCAALQVAYLAAAKGQGIVADARLLREGKELCFVAVDVAGDDAKPIAQITGIAHARSDQPPATLRVAAGDHGQGDPGPMGPHIARIPFIGARGIRVEHMSGETSRLVMPWRDSNAAADGGVDEGAVLALLDTAGAMASWAVNGVGRFRAGTPGMQARLFAPPPRADLVAYGHCTQRDSELFWSDVEVACADDGRVIARGTVVYRITG